MYHSTQFRKNILKLLFIYLFFICDNYMEISAIIIIKQQNIINLMFAT